MSLERDPNFSKRNLARLMGGNYIPPKKQEHGRAGGDFDHPEYYYDIISLDPEGEMITKFRTKTKTHHNRPDKRAHLVIIERSGRIHPQEAIVCMTLRNFRRLFVDDDNARERERQRREREKFERENKGDPFDFLLI